jgi:PiT family inorganic phosphate transporter
MGVGSSKGRRGVHWGVARSILIAWVVTLPATALAGALAWGALATLGIR